MIPRHFLSTLKPISNSSPIPQYFAASFINTDSTEYNFNVWRTDTWAPVYQELPGDYTYHGYGVSFSPDVSIMATIGRSSGSGTTSTLRILQTSDWSEVTTINTTGYGLVIANTLKFSDDGAYLACGFSTSPYLRVWDTSDWSLVTLSSAPTSTVRCLDWQVGSAHLLVGVASSPYFNVYSSGGTFTKLSNPASLPTSLTWAVCFLNDEESHRFVVTSDSGTLLRSYSLSGSTITIDPLPAQPPNIITGLEGTVIASLLGSAPYYNVYLYNSYTPLSLQSTIQVAGGLSEFSAIARDTNPLTGYVAFAGSGTNKLVIAEGFYTDVTADTVGNFDDWGECTSVSFSNLIA